MSTQTVAVLGASANPERYSHQAVVLLGEMGHKVIPVNPALDQVHGLRAAKSLTEVAAVDTLTLYVGSARLPALAEEIIRLKPGRVIFNPGTESPELQAALASAGISWLEACTLVLLRTGRF